jgi:hypothetical protein
MNPVSWYSPLFTPTSLVTSHFLKGPPIGVATHICTLMHIKGCKSSQTVEISKRLVENTYYYYYLLGYNTSLCTTLSQMQKYIKFLVYEGFRKEVVWVKDFDRGGCKLFGFHLCVFNERENSLFASREVVLRAGAVAK